MRDVAIVTDSTSDLPQDWAAEHDIAVVPLSVVIDGQAFEDGSFTQEEYFAKMASMQGLPTTSQPPVGVFVDAYREALEKARSVVGVHISSKLSGTFQAAAEAASQIGDRVTVFDSLNLSGGLGLVTMAAARAAKTGSSVSEVVDAAERARDRVKLYVGFDGFENLLKGGRIGKVQGLMGGMLNIRPTIEVVDGEFEPVAKQRGAQAQLRHIVDTVATDMAGRTGGRFVVLHAMAADRAAQIRAEIEERFKPAQIVTQEAGTVISTHTGTGVGVAFIPQD